MAEESVQVGISFSEEIFKEIEKRRGIANRSSYVEQLILSGLNKISRLENDLRAEQERLEEISQVKYVRKLDELQARYENLERELRDKYQSFSNEVE